MVTFKQGTPIMGDHTPTSAVTGGDVVVMGENVGIAHSDIAANTLGALGRGGGIYQFPKGTSTGDGWSDGDAIYWDTGNSVATTDPTDEAFVGFAVGDAADTDANALVLHWPQTIGSQS